MYNSETDVVNPSIIPFEEIGQTRERSPFILLPLVLKHGNYEIHDTTISTIKFLIIFLTACLSKEIEPFVVIC